MATSTHKKVKKLSEGIKAKQAENPTPAPKNAIKAPRQVKETPAPVKPQPVDLESESPVTLPKRTYTKKPKVVESSRKRTTGEPHGNNF